MDEPDETILLGGSVDAPGIAVAGATLTLTDNDTATVLVTPTTVSIAAGGTGSYTMSLQSRPTHLVMVALTVQGDADAADISPRQLAFPITEEWDDPLTVTITDSEDADTWIDELIIEHAVTSTDPNYHGASAAPVTATVADADVPVLSVSVTGATEGAEDAQATFVVELTADDDQEARVSYATSNGTATSGEDYDAASGELVFAAGETSKTVAVTVRDDGAYEGDETLLLTLSGAVNAALPGAGPSFSATIADDETAPTGIALAVSPTTVAENAASAARTVTVTATLQGANPLATARTVSVSFSNPADESDKSVVRYADPDDAEMVIAAGAMNAEFEFELAPVDDVIGGQADAVISVTGVDAGGLQVTGTTLTVTDDDDPPVGIALSTSPSALSEANTDRTTISVTATVDGATRFAAALAVNLSLGGTAAADVDYSHDPLPSIAIAAGAATGVAEFTLGVIDDALDEDDPETIVVSATVAGASPATVTSATINLADNDGAGVTVSRSTVTVPAGGAADYALSLRSRPTHPVTVDLGVPSQDAATVAPTRLVFPATDAWDEHIGVTITDADDADTIDDELEITHAVASADPNYNGASAVPVTVTVADADVPVLSVSVTGATEGAEDAQATFVVELTVDDDQEARVSYATSNGTATAGEDYDAASGELVFAAGETSKTVAVTVRDDGAYEGDETLLLTLSDAVNAALPGDGPSFSASIADDETAPTGIALAVSPTTVAENAASSARMVTVTATLQGANPLATARTVSVSFSNPADESNKSVVRYADPADAKMVIAAGAMDVEFEFELAPVDDAIGGQADAVISVTGTEAGGLPVTAATLTVTDDDDPPGGIALSTSPSVLSEANTDRTTILVTATVDGATRFASALTITLSLGGTATADADYTHDPPPSIAIAAGAATGTAEFTLGVIDDSVDESDPETIVVSATVAGASSVTVTSATINLADNDGAGVTVSPNAVTVSAGGTADYALSLRSRPTHPVTVDLTVRGDADAASIAPRQLVFPTTEAWDDPLTVTITDADDADTWIDALTIAHAVTSTDPNYNGATAAPVTATVADDDVPVLSVTEPQESEGEGAALEFEVMLSAADDQDSTVAFETRNGTATAGEDYAARSGTITIEAGSRSATVRIELLDDALYEGDETLLLVLTLPQASNAALPGGRTELVAAGTIVDGETAATELVLSASPGQIEEDAGATEVVVMVSIPDGGAPFDEPRTVRVSLPEPVPNNYAMVGHEAVEPLEIIIPAGATVATETLTLIPVNDDISGQIPTRIEVSGEAAANSGDTGNRAAVDNAAGNSLAVTPTVLTIIDDDVTELSMPPPGSTYENADPGELPFEVTASKPSAVDIEVEFETADGTAVAGEDYLRTTGTLTIAAGNRSAVVRVMLRDDNLYEGDETVNLILRNPRNALLSGDVARLEATGTIGDDEAAALGVTLSVDPPSVAEDAGEVSVMVTARVAGDTLLARRSTIVLSLAGTARPTEDYELASIPVLVIEAGSSIGTATLMLIPVDDEIDEPDIETVEISGSVIEDGGTEDLLVTSATLRIADNDTAVLSATAAPAYENAAPAELVFDIVLSSPSDRNVEMEFETRDVEQHAGDATAGDDYEKVSGMLTIAAGDQSATVRVTLYDDRYYEGPENLELTLRNIVNASFEGGGSTLVVTGTINDDEFDAAGVALAVQPPSLSEADGPTQITVTATLSGSAPFQDRRAITLTFSGTALTGADYEPPEPPPIVIAAGATSGVVTFTLTPMNDDLDEPDTETIIIDGAVDAGASELSVAPATLALRDDDQAGLVVTTPTLDAGGGSPSAPVSVVVSEGSTTVYSLALGSQPSSETEVALRSSHPDKATLQPTRLTFTAADWNQARQITVTGTRDDDVLDDRATVTHASSSAGGGYPSLEVSIEVLVTDDDVPRLVAIEHATTPMREGVYGFTEEIRLVLTFTRPVRVEGRPRLRLTFDNEERFAEYQSGSFSTELTFAYVVRENDRADDGLRILVNPVRLDDGTAITDAEHADIDADTEWNEVIEIPVGVNGNMDPLLAAVAGDDFEASEVTDADRASGAADAVVTLDGSDSVSAEPERLAYAWAPSSSNTVRVSLENADAAVTRFTVPNLPQTTRLEFVLTVTNTRTNERDSDSVVVTIKAENEAPVADAGDDQTVQEGTPVTLDGSGSSDPEGLPLTFAWSIVGDQHEVGIKGADTARPTFTSPTKLRADAALVFELTVTDHAGLTHADRVTITTRAVNLNPIMKHALAAFGRSVGSSAVDALGERFDSSNRLSRVFGVGSKTPATNPVDDISMNWGTSAADATATYSPGGLAPGPMWNEHHIGTPLMPGNDTLPLRNPMVNGGFNLGIGKWWGGNKKEDENNQENGAEHDTSGDDPPQGDPGEPTASRGDHYEDDYYEDDYYEAEAAEQPDAGAKWMLWGRSDMRGFDGKPAQGLSLNGSMNANYVGIDRRLQDRGVVGVALSMAGGSMDYESGAINGEVDINLRSLLPYGRWRLDRGMSVWGILGLGSGTAEIATDYGRRAEADLSMQMLAVGMHQALMTICGVDVSAKGDALRLTMDAQAASDADDLRDDLQASVSRLRLAVESRGVLVLSRTAQLRPSAELAVRIDGGDAETGFGMEMLGGMSYVDAQSGITAESRVRYLLMHASGTLREWGASMSMEWDPGAKGGLGLSLEPVWGRMGTDPSSRWRGDDPFDVGTLGGPAHGDRQPLILNASLRYELYVSDWRLRPYATLDMNSTRRHRRTGLHFEALELERGEVKLDLFGEWGGDEHPFGYGLEARLRLSVY